MLMRITGIISIAVGGIILLFFEHYHGSVIPYPWLILLGGAVLYWGGWYIKRKAVRQAKKAAEQARTEELQQFKNNSLTLNVQLEECRVIRNDYMEEVLRETTGFSGMDSRIRGWDALTDETLNTRRQQVNRCVLQYETTIRGAKCTFTSEELNVDHTTLLFRMDMQKTATIYYNAYNPSEHYFDVSMFKGNADL